MSALTWAAWGEEWALAEPVSFDGRSRRIVVNTGVESLSIQTIYSAWKRWMQREQNAMYLPAMRATGGDPIPGGITGSTFFVVNDWKLCYNATAVAVAGVLYSEDYGTAFWSLDATDPIYPATVSALVNSAVSYTNVVTGTALTPAETAAAVWGAAARTLTSSLDPNASQIAAAVLAQILASVVPANIKQVNDLAIIGSGVPESDPWRPA
jgi:hypothetical protein